MLKVTNNLLKNEAERRGWKVEILSEAGGLLRYSLPSGKTVILQSLTSPFTGAVSQKIADDKYTTYQLALQAKVPVPETHIVKDKEESEELLQKYKTVVIKPLDSAHGNGVTTNVTDSTKLETAIEKARAFSDEVLLQPQLRGKDVRVLIIGGELAACAQRRPASVVADGVSTLGQLIVEENKNPDRGENYQKKLNLIDEEVARNFLGDKINEVPSKGETCTVVGTANIGTGGTAEDITELVPEALIEASKKMLAVAGLPVGAADFMWDEDSFYLLEINANPSLGLHVYPTIGDSRPVHKLFLDWISTEAER